MQSRTPSLLPQNIPSFAKPLLQALAVIVGATLVFGALWARADDPHAPPSTSSVHASP